VPHRIQRKRVKGWRMPPGAVYVGRPTKWGNPCTVENLSVILLGKDPATGRQTFGGRSPTAEDVVKWFREAAESPEVNLGWSLDELRAALRGKDLACWCPLGAPCHADVLLELANAE